MLGAFILGFLTIIISDARILLRVGTLSDINLYLWVPIIIVSAFIAAGILKYKVYRHLPQWFSKIWSILRKRSKETGRIEPIDDETLDELIKGAGYAYDARQDIFYSILDAWQRDMGYCRLYDEAAAPMGMIMDCEPIYFNYGGKKWLIEFWKGQYDLTTGAEIGVYNTSDPDLDIPEFFTGTFYNAVNDEEMLRITFVLKKDGRTLLTRYDRHWWVTGFIVGEFSEPWELTLSLNIALKNKEMRDAFVEGLMNAGYSKDEIIINGNKVGLVFDKPRTPQPITRTELTDSIIQKKNKFMCDTYQEITHPYDNFLDKINSIGEKAPEIYNLIINVGRAKQIYNAYNKIKDYLS